MASRKRKRKPPFAVGDSVVIVPPKKVQAKYGVAAFHAVGYIEKISEPLSRAYPDRGTDPRRMYHVRIHLGHAVGQVYIVSYRWLRKSLGQQIVETARVPKNTK